MAGESERRGSGPLQDVVPAAVKAKLAQLAELGIELLPLQGLERHFVFCRQGYIALVTRTEEGFGQVGSAGVLTERGMAVLVWKRGKPYFVAKGFEIEATEEQVTALRTFARDLERVIYGGEVPR